MCVPSRISYPVKALDLHRDWIQESRHLNRGLDFLCTKYIIESMEGINNQSTNNRLGSQASKAAGTKLSCTEYTEILPLSHMHMAIH
jgi:hypothetical protein